MSREQSASNIICRKTISGSGGIGDLYDIVRDCFVKKSNLTTEVRVDKPLQTTECRIIAINDRNESLDILRQIVSDGDLRLSIWLDLAPTVGIGAFFNYHREINANTRILHYVHQAFSQKLPNAAGSEVKLRDLKASDISHAVGQIDFGIEALIILQAPDDVSMTKIDVTISNLSRKLLKENPSALEEWLKDKDLHMQLKPLEVIVYSNMPQLTRINKASDIPSRLAQIKKESKLYRPINYYLQPIKSIYPSYKSCGNIFHSLHSDVVFTIENYVYRLRSVNVFLENSFKSSNLSLLKQYLKEDISYIKQEWVQLQRQCEKKIKYLSDLILEFRQGQNNIAQIEQALSNKSHKASLEDRMHQLTSKVGNWEKKGQLISSLRRDGFKYYNVENNIMEKDTKEDLERKLINDQKKRKILCTSDELRVKEPQQFNERQRSIMQEQKRNRNLQLIYADFTYSKHKLPETIVLSSADTKKTINKSKVSNTQKFPTSAVSKSSPASAKEAQVDTSSARSFALTSADDTINILLLGESGVGKSTFINALVNYLAFDSFEDAQSNSPTVLITISFLITTGDDFEEHIIKFVDFDHSNNEDFDHPGQSVTQQCRSYVFSLRGMKEKKVRIIDTPGFGDTRGLAQDDLNIEHILRYIYQFTHLNSICFLFKPNSSQLNMFFQSCLMQLFGLLGPNVQQNIIFCFTNARSTFYTPGDTAPLLKKLLQSLPFKNIQFQKDNTFCFDNESFRYLVALQNGITFTDVDRQEYEMSWNNAVKESHRFLDYISTKLPIYYMRENGPSIKEAQLKIELLIRPILEAIRNLLRNLNLVKSDEKNQFITMYAQPLDYTAAQCLSCPPTDPVKIGPFSIRSDFPHRFVNDCKDCACDHAQHIPINYTLEYEIDTDESNRMHQKDMIDMLTQLCDASAKFSYFLMYTARSTKDNPFFLGLVRMIMEENELNPQLAKGIRQINDQHEELMHRIEMNKKENDLQMIYELISTIEELLLIKEQMIAIKETQEILMEKHQYDVS